jgi:hypothetical protein
VDHPVPLDDARALLGVLLDDPTVHFAEDELGREVGGVDGNVAAERCEQRGTTTGLASFARPS